MNRELKDIKSNTTHTIVSNKGSAAYWTGHMVANKAFTSAEESLEHFHWRNDQYPGYIDLMPVHGQDGKVVLDYGCGPGNDVVGFATYSNVKKLIAADVSPTALEAAKRRLQLHNKNAEFMQVDENKNDIPLPDKSVDYIHTSGVLHHCANLGAILNELHRILKDDGQISVMVYNYSSIWVHLYVAYILQIQQGKFKENSIIEAFRRSTDGENCPISNCYKPGDFISLMRSHGFEGKLKGAAISKTEMKYIGKRLEATEDRRLAEEHRVFLSELTFNEKGIPLHNGVVAGIDACYQLEKQSLEKTDGGET